MVMEAQPSPQSVGREFVRQYYTLLNKAPDHLHRFYNNSSSFVHGGFDSNNREPLPVVIGQKQIHNKIQQLNFRDCHAKISQVDAQATLGNGVVVQVTGELSNDGQPMRRFTQTFVLAAQSPKKYYVHNDIFRYQDYYSDEDIDESAKSDVEDEIEQPEQSAVDQQQQQQQQANATNAVLGHQQMYYPPNVMNSAPPNLLPNYGQPQMNGGHDRQALVHEDLPRAPSHSPPMLQSTTPVMPMQTSTISQPPSQAAPAQTNMMTSMEPPMVQQPVQQQQPQPTLVAEQLPKEIESPVSVSTSEPTPDKGGNDIEQLDSLNDDSMPQQQTSLPNEPKTYANLLKSGGGSISSYSYAAMSSSSPSTYTSNQISPTATGNKYPMDSNRQDGSSTTMSSTRAPLEQRSSVSRSLRGNTTPGQNVLNKPPPERNNYMRPSYNDEERRQSGSNSQFGDSHQLFLGNLPHHATEEDLKAMFSKFGAVVDLRIHSKPGQKITGTNRAPPNYGFITFEDPQSVQNCLANMPLYFPDNSPDGQKLNIEEKKTRNRGPGETGGRIGGNMMSGNNGPRPHHLGGGNNRQRGLDGPRGGGSSRGGTFNRSDRGSISGQRSGNGVSSNPIGGGNNNYGRR